MNAIHIVCPDCAAVNRIPIERVNHKPFCGKCKQPLFTGSPVDLYGNNFVRHISRNDIPVIVDFWAPWCGPCKAMAPIFKAVALKLEPSVRLAKTNTDQAQDIAAQYNIRSIPTLIIFKAGQEIARHSGTMSETDLIRWIDRHA